jgi:hypothetical protein
MRDLEQEHQVRSRASQPVPLSVCLHSRPRQACLDRPLDRPVLSFRFPTRISLIDPRSTHHTVLVPLVRLDWGLVPSSPHMHWVDAHAAPLVGRFEYQVNADFCDIPTVRRQEKIPKKHAGNRLRVVLSVY